MDIKHAFADPKIEVDGVWIDYLDGGRIKIARLGNPAWQRKFDNLMRPFRDLERRNRLPIEKQTEIICESYVNTVLLDWEGFTDGGRALKFTPETAKTLLVVHMDFRDDVTRYAADGETFKRELDEASEGN